MELLEAGPAPDHVELGLHGLFGVGAVPGVTRFEGRLFALGHRCVGLAAQVGVDVGCRFLAVADGDGRRALGRHHVAGANRSIEIDFADEPSFW